MEKGQNEREILHRIKNALLVRTPFIVANGLDGKLAACLFFFHYAEWLDSMEYNYFAVELLKNILQKELQNKENISCRLNTGLTGLALTLLHCWHRQFIDTDLEETLSPIEGKILKRLDIIEPGDPISMHEFIDIVIYLIHRVQLSGSPSALDDKLTAALNAIDALPDLNEYHNCALGLYLIGVFRTELLPPTFHQHRKKSTVPSMFTSPVKVYAWLMVISHSKSISKLLLDPSLDIYRPITDLIDAFVNLQLDEPAKDLHHDIAFIGARSLQKPLNVPNSNSIPV